MIGKLDQALRVVAGASLAPVFLVIITVIVGWWAIHRDINDLRDRMSGLEQCMSRLEGSMDVITNLFKASAARNPQ